MKQHILIEKAFCYTEPTVEPIPLNCTYDNHNGYWLTSSNEVMMLSDNPQKPNTKKCDRETGEDQKGE